MISFLRLFWGEQNCFKHFKVSCHCLLDWAIIIKKSTMNSIIVLLKIMNLFPLLTAFKISHLCFLLLLLNERFFKFYNASQFSEVSHTWFCIVVVVQSLSHVQLFVTPWTAAFQASLSFPISWSLLGGKPFSNCNCLLHKVKVLSSLMDTSIQAYPVFQYICFC